MFKNLKVIELCDTACHPAGSTVIIKGWSAVILMFAVSLLMYGGLGLTITPPAA